MKQCVWDWNIKMGLKEGLNEAKRSLARSILCKPRVKSSFSPFKDPCQSLARAVCYSVMVYFLNPKSLESDRKH